MTVREGYEPLRSPGMIGLLLGPLAAPMAAGYMSREGLQENGLRAVVLATFIWALGCALTAHLIVVRPWEARWMAVVIFVLLVGTVLVASWLAADALGRGLTPVWSSLGPMGGFVGALGGVWSGLTVARLEHDA